MRVAAHTKKGSSPRSTQVQGPREEVRPLLLPFFVYILGFLGLQSGIRVESGSIKWNPGRVRVYFTGRIQVILSLLSPHSLSVIDALSLFLLSLLVSGRLHRRGGGLFILLQATVGYTVAP